jgi:hypothetical protein
MDIIVMIANTMPMINGDHAIIKTIELKKNLSIMILYFVANIKNTKFISYGKLERGIISVADICLPAFNVYDVIYIPHL